MTQSKSIIDPNETWLEKWLLHEAGEVYNYYSCVAFESNPRIKEIWERFLDYELGQLHFVMDLFAKMEKRDPAEILPETMPDPISYESQRQFVRKVLAEEVDLRAVGTQFVDKSREPKDGPSAKYRKQLNSDGSPSESVAAGYIWLPGTELSKESVMPGEKRRAA